jgi:hypothetical protein
VARSGTKSGAGIGGRFPDFASLYPGYAIAQRKWPPLRAAIHE